MTKLDELIQEYCPDGVEYKRLGDIATISRGGSFQKKDYIENGIPCIHYGQIYMNYGLFAEKTLSYISEKTAQKQRFAESGDIIMAVTSENIDDVCKCMAWLGNEKVAVSGHTAIIRHSINPKYLVYWLHSSAFYQQKAKIAHGTKVIEVAPVKLADVILPVPPLPVQREIVRILDNFTEHITELTEQLNLELTARKKQYEFYRNQLLTFDAQGATILTDRQTDRQTDKPNALNRLCQYVSEFIFVKLSDISVNCDSLRKPVTSGNREAGNIPYYGASGIVDYVKDYIFDGDYLLISEDGANLLARNTPIAFSISGKNWVNNHAHILRFNNRITQRYVEIYLNSIDLSPYISGGAQPKLNQQNLYKIPIPLPSYQKQKEIVTILDRFDTLCTDLSSGLPAEIEARQKQYEYYRDKLLTFGERFN